MTTGKAVLSTHNVVAIAGIAIVVALCAATWNLRGFITSELDEATAATNQRLEAAVAAFREENRATRETVDRHMAEIRRFIFELDREDGDDDEDDNEEAAWGPR